MIWGLEKTEVKRDHFHGATLEERSSGLQSGQWKKWYRLHRRAPGEKGPPQGQRRKTQSWGKWSHCNTF